LSPIHFVREGIRHVFAHKPVPRRLLSHRSRFAAIIPPSEPRETEFAMRSRAWDYLLLLAVSVALTLPGLGANSLWDVDEGVNAQAAREMQDADTWVIPTFNYQLRTAKPVMLYWLQRTSYSVFGVSEWSARLPSALAAWLAILLTYEIARRMFDRGTGLLSGLVLVSAIQFAILSHAATPDATLLLFTVLTYFAFWRGHLDGGRSWWVPTAFACGLAVLTKGPVGVLLPALVVGVYFAWNRELNRIFDRKLFAAAAVFVFTAVPWYALVASETRGEWLKAFFGNENVNRFLNAMEGHGGGIWFYPLAVLVLFSPWSAFLPAALWYSVRAARSSERANESSPISAAVRAYRFLICWAATYVLFFSLAATKLPNYVFPMYPAVAILTARFLVAWRDGTLSVPRRLLPAGACVFGFIGVALACGLLYGEQAFPGLRAWAALGLIPVGGAVGMAWFMRKDNRPAAVNSAVVAAILLAGILVFPTRAMDRQRAPRELVRATGLADPTRDVRVATFEWFQPSVVFYTGREVDRLDSVEELNEFLAVPTPAYLFLPAPSWERVAANVTARNRIAARHPDFLKQCDIVVITNQPGGDLASR
jgi:4-amino-4-deoxy-L-arabinose transferase-like glycosyltransferase